MKSHPEGWIKPSVPESAGEKMPFYTCAVHAVLGKVLGVAIASLLR